MKSVVLERIKNDQFVIIAECGVNYYDIAKVWNISLIEAAKLMIKEATEAGAHAVKFQTYKADTLAVKDSPAYWDMTEEPERTQYELFKKFDKLGRDDYAHIAKFCIEQSVEFMSTAFDFESADYLDEMMSIFKISSSDVTNIPFIKHQARKMKPIILSVGASNLDEIEMATAAIRAVNDHPLALLHCVLEYPTPYEHANLNKITSLRRHFPDFHIGYSDHTKPDKYLDVVKTAYNLGATIIEKHFTLDKTLTGNDHYHAMDPEDLLVIVESLQFIDEVRGSGKIEALQSEASARLNARRSIVAAREIKKGTVLTDDMLTFKRPGHGISPAELDTTLGKHVVVDICEDAVLFPEMVGE
jgi:N-acetylneuraminate synthase